MKNNFDEYLEYLFVTGQLNDNNLENEEENCEEEEKDDSQKKRR